MGIKRGATCEYNGVIFAGWSDEDTGDITELSASFPKTGYWGNEVRTYVVRDDDDTWYIECGANNQMADFSSNSWETWHSESGFTNIEDAFDACFAWVDGLD